MALTFRTDDVTRWGTGQGANLTPAQVDLNFWDVHSRILGLETNPPQAIGISNITVIGSQMRVFLADATEFGPFTLPTAVFRWRGDWQPLTSYLELDIVNVQGLGVFLVLQNHTSAASFDPAESNSVGDFYFQIFGQAVAQPAPVRGVGGTTFQPDLVNFSEYLRMTHVGGCAVTVPSDSEAGFAINTEIHFRQAGGVITFDAGSAVQLNGVAGFLNQTAAQGAVATIKKVAVNEWDLFGLLAEDTSGGSA